jgi:NAD(P)-dependent dehydrogenase (short-subunit alcohol dehydrogenase family)
MTRRVALVTGASRGVGRGIAVALGAAGWRVYLTARSTGGERTSHLPGTVEEAAAAVTAAGGEATGIACDHRDDRQTRAVAERITAEAGRLDLLVNNAWAGYERLNAGAWTEWTAPFWEQPLELWDAMFGSGVRAHYVSTVLCAPLLRRTPESLLVTISVRIEAAHQERYGMAYSMAKAADDRLAVAAAAALRPDRVTSVALHPGLVRTEGVMQFAEHLDLTSAESPAGVGRVVAALADDPDRHDLTGRSLTVAELAARYEVDTAT